MWRFIEHNISISKYYRMRKIIIPIVLIIGIIIFYFVNPEHSGLFPKCAFYSLTGLQCPACGTQRAVYHLLHFHVIEALKYNLFLVISVPYLLALIVVQWFDKNNKLHKLRTFCHHYKTIRVYILLIILWWIGRNLTLWI